MNKTMSLSDKYKREVERNANLTKRLAELMIKLGDKDRLIVQQDKVLGEGQLKILELKQKLSEINVDKN